MPSLAESIRFSLAMASILGGIALMPSAVRADDPPPSRPPTWPDPAQIGSERSEPSDQPEAGAEAEAGSAAEGKADGEAEPDGPLDPFFDLIDPAQIQRLFDKALARRFDLPRAKRVRPEVPEIGEPVFFDLTRPLGAQKYSNELNYLFNSSTRTAPTLQVIEYEYAFADWNAVELDLSYFDQRLEIITPFYQRTLGVGRHGRSISGLQVSPDIYLRSGFIGGSAVYVYGWKPSKESKFSTLSFLGVNRQLIGGFFAQTPTVSSATSMQGSTAVARATDYADRIYGAWRPTYNIDLFYKLTPSLSLGIENDLFFQARKGGEYLSFPFVTWEAGQHAFFQVGGGYYHFESKDQFTFLVHLNFVNPSVRRREEEKAEETTDERPELGTEEGEAEAKSPAGGRIRQWFGRHWPQR